ncbi:carboxypeptidase-like regulatory domain-containing protein [Pirellula sp. SH-Sr6A]|uniref:carboxypeptidase-like regulatory domain-containing protein n=1 Tax=Pirellula sp. SH-Sr6A TaxID=1632865 RepID=UPI0011BAC75E|nr:carboxypeptidase-like regulatory domain-containing protein [Pirellula sp. SH-Sr6A]
MSLSFLSRSMFCLGVCSFAVWLGCGPKSDLPKTVKAQGVVTLDGTPVDLATIVLIPDAGTYSAAGVSDKDGKFALKAFDEKAGAVPGSYKVEITKTVVQDKGEKGGEAVVNVAYGLPKKYSTFTTSGLKLTIPDQDTTDIKFELTSK